MSDDSTMRRDIAVLVLAFADYEALEISLACHMAYGDPAVPLFVVHNGRLNYDTDRTLSVARRYARLHPGRIQIIGYHKARPPYDAIRQALDEELAGFDLVCKVDDDVFPIAPGWLGSLEMAFRAAEAEGRPAAFAAPLINNNTDGFTRVLDAMALREVFRRDISIPHMAGAPGAQRLIAKGDIAIGTRGTIWALPHAARWLHENTTLRPDDYLAATAALPVADLPSQERFSIGCMLFRRRLWSDISDGSTGLTDDEGLVHTYCAERQARILCVQSVPFVHIAYLTQREENRDLVPRIRQTYEQRLSLPYPVSLYGGDRLLEIEARMRWQQRRRNTRRKAPPRRGVLATLAARLWRLIRT